LCYLLPVDGSDLCREAMEPVSLNTLQVTPPRPVSEAKKSVIDFDDFEKLLGLLRESSISLRIFESAGIYLFC
jgi:hypothetical protein